MEVTLLSCVIKFLNTVCSPVGNWLPTVIVVFVLPGRVVSEEGDVSGKGPGEGPGEGPGDPSFGV